MSLASSQPTSPPPRVGSTAALAHPFAQPRSLLTRQPHPARGSGFAHPVSLASTDDAPRLGVAQSALKAARSVLPRLLFL
jgi:hypothetical protein